MSFSIPRKANPARIWKVLVCFLLFFSAVLTAVMSRTVQPENPPDEAQHFSLIRYLANHPFEFPVRYEHVKGEYKQYNAIIHPPLYYYAMACVLRFVDTNNSSGWQGADPMNQEKRGELILKVRVFSLFFAFCGLWGMFRLLFWLMNQGWLAPSMAAAAAVLSVFIPSFLYGYGALNNDVFVWALWPFLTLYSARFYCVRHMDDLFRFLFFAGLMVLSKATAWFLIAGLSVPVAGGLLSWYSSRKSFQDKQRSEAKRTWQGLFWAAAAAFFLVLALLHVGRLVITYGTPQPAYWKVYGIPLQDSQFYRISPGGLPERSFFQLSREAGISLIQTASGIIGHKQRAYDSKPENLLLMLFAGTSTLLVLGIVPLLRRSWKDSSRPLFLAAVFISVPVAFLLIFLGYCRYAYYLQGMYGNHARYFTGYLQVFWIGLMMLVSTPACASFWPPLVRRVLSAGTVGVLAYIFCRPHYFFQHMEDGQRFINQFIGVTL